MTRGAALAPLLVEAMIGAKMTGAEMTGVEIAAPPSVTHQGMAKTYRSHDQMMAAFAADMATGKWECDDEDRGKLARWQAARQRKAPQPCRARRPRSRSSHRRVGSARSSTKAGASDPDGSSSEPPRPRRLAIWGALDVGDILEGAPAPTRRSASASNRSRTRCRGNVYAAGAELDQRYVPPAGSGSAWVGGEPITLGDEDRRHRRAITVACWTISGFVDGTGWIHERVMAAKSAVVSPSPEPIHDPGGQR